jgi:hypothetical protein
MCAFYTSITVFLYLRNKPQTGSIFIHLPAADVWPEAIRLGGMGEILLCGNKLLTQ